MLTRISLIVAIIAGLAVGTLNFVKVKTIITDTRAERDSERSQKEQVQTELASTQSELSTTKTELSQTQENLKSTTEQRNKAVATAESQTKRANQLNEELTTTKSELGTVQAEVAAYRQIGTTTQVAAMSKMLKDSQDSLSEAQLVIRTQRRDNEKLQSELDKYTLGAKRIVYLPNTLKGQVVVSDPKWDFVVLNVGEDQQVREDGELLVNRNGKLVAKVKVTSVQKDRCVANVVPGWKLGEILEGDQVIPAHPKS